MRIMSLGKKSFLFIFISIVNVQSLHAKAKRKDIGKLVFERSCFDVIHYDVKVKIKPNEKFISDVFECSNMKRRMISGR